MDGVKKCPRNSLKTRLSYWISAAILSVAIIAASFTFSSAFEEAHELQDDVLQQMAVLFDRYSLTPNDSTLTPLSQDQLEFQVSVQLLGDNPASNPITKNILALPSNLTDGFHTVNLATQSWRVFVRTLSSSQRIAVAQETAIRDNIAFETALHTLMPLLVLIPILLLLLGYILGKILSPISILAHDVDRQTEHDLQLIPTTQLPSEIVPFVEAINRLLSKNSQVITSQKRFIADAAHELRSPITALSLQAQRLQQTELTDDARQKLNALQAGICRSIHLLEQLLSMARQQDNSIQQHQRTSLKTVFTEVIEELYPLVEAKEIDLGFSQDSDAQLNANPVRLKTLIHNLIDNAIRYTPSGGRVDLSIIETEQGIEMTVKDTGPGIANTEVQKVFEPFYRILGSNEYGSGLGLAIVASIVQQMDAKISLTPADPVNNCGLCVTVQFPL
ncbi:MULTISPECIES: ATP-binding protein [Shewanella]|uniref:sensor histidine kinase n=1 Tax=Shewanella TaxID=22 RepID=UPI000C55C982|nr:MULTISPECIES: ATP-binding protein [Shewanella]NCQ45807.1 two-component sensor histidine kinase [Shewanella frigidimarina]NCO72478.1 two-component sensor histidine kinase [Shewanella vesiculosa]NCP36172.1 two-component sensor histidine kinase [Shewanella vesiculosa]NCP69493.1 two-component sensor histidine kinase [Shewanella vesiculosa]NCP73836.1 two-component sensor histidine kinase [Shewanella vesiculosa]